jgi:hypothetical protein
LYIIKQMTRYAIQILRKFLNKATKATPKYPHKSPGVAGVKSVTTVPSRQPRVLNPYQRRELIARNLPGNKGLGYQSDSPFGFNPLKRQIAGRLSRRPKYKVGSNRWNQQVSQDVRDFAMKQGIIRPGSQSKRTLRIKGQD